jgi:FkbM family methyltransferase
MRNQLLARLERYAVVRLVAIPVWLAVTFKWSRLRYWTLRHWFHSSIFVEEWEMGMCSHCPEQMLAFVLNRFHPRSVLDLGCGTGKTLDYLLAQGLDAQGTEGSAMAISRARHPERIRRHDLQKPLDLGRRFDLLWCFEVAEHIRPAKVDVLLDTIALHSDLVVLSAARPGQGGDGHFNEQPPEYWIERMGRHGYRLLREETERLHAIPETHSGNMLVFQRTGPGHPRPARGVFARLHDWLQHGVPRYRHWVGRRAHQRLVSQGTVAYRGVQFDIRESHAPIPEAIVNGRYEAEEQALCAQLLRPDDRVLECGGNIGFLALLARRLWGISTWVSLEPNPRTAALYRANFALNHETPRLIEAAASAQDGTLDLFCGGLSTEDSLIARRADQDRIQVPTMSFRSIVTQIGFAPTALVMDIEGAETLLLEAELPASIRVIIVELHPHAIGHKQCFAILARLGRDGFAVEAVAGQVHALVRTGPAAS